MRQCMCKSMVVCLNWGVVGDGRRPILSSEMNGHCHIALIPHFLMFEHAPPSVR